MRRMTIHERGEYLSDVIFAASDGIVTTFAVVAGSAGAQLDPRIVLIMGFANLFADGFSMASGNYIGAKSEIEFEEVNGKGKEAKTEGIPFLHGLFTFVSFNIAGLIPLAPFVFKLEPKFGFAIIFVFFGLFIVGALRNMFTKRGLVRSGMESVFVGGFAAFVAFISGYLIDKFLF